MNADCFVHNLREETKLMKVQEQRRSKQNLADPTYEVRRLSYAQPETTFI